MSKRIWLTILGTVISLQVFAEPISDLQFLAKVISFNSQTATIQAEGKKYVVPRTALKGEPTAGKTQQIVLSQKQYAEMTFQNNTSAEKK